jgi:hypothetical protein
VVRDVVPVRMGADYQEVRLTFDGAEPLTVICRAV